MRPPRWERAVARAMAERGEAIRATLMEQRLCHEMRALGVVVHLSNAPGRDSWAKEEPTP